MGKNAWIEPGGYIVIDTTAWLQERTGGPDPDLTADLHAWAATHTDTGQPTGPDDPDDVADTSSGEAALVPVRRDWGAAAQAWCRDRGHTPAEADVIGHVETRLDAQVWVVRATVGTGYRIAVVGINHEAPTVYAEACTDSWDWFDADSVDIWCPKGHGWTWRTGRELVTAQGTFTTIAVAFGPDLDAPFTPCPACTAHRLDPSLEPCGCDGAPWIVCPTCGGRCDVELPTH